MKYYTSIDSDNRYKEIDYTIKGKSILISTEDLADIMNNIQEREITILLHANDIRNSKRRRQKILETLVNKKYKIYLFTNSTTRAARIEGFNDVTYTWDEVQKCFPILPPKSASKTYLITLSILCQGYLAAHRKIKGLPDNLEEIAINNWAKVKDNWWKPALGEDLNGAELKIELMSSDMSEEEANALIQDVREHNIEKVYETVRSILSVKS